MNKTDWAQVVVAFGDAEFRQRNNNRSFPKRCNRFKISHKSTMYRQQSLNFRQFKNFACM